MTTKVTVAANHGWPVKVRGVNPKTGEDANYGGTIPKNEQRDFYCHSSMDLIVHEIQPDEDNTASE